MKIFRYAADRLPVTLFLALFVADLAVFLLVDAWWLVLAWAVVGLAPKFCICAWNHHHQHVHTFRYRALDAALEIVYALQTGALPSTWVMHHNVGHHKDYLDQARDPSAWKTATGRRMGEHEYAAVVAALAYPRMLKIGLRYRKHLKRFARLGLIVVVLLAAALWYRPLAATALLLVPMAIGLYVTAWHTYFHHSGLDTDDPLAASYNIDHKFYNLLMGNLGFHTAHHVRCSVHWSEVPALHQSIAHQIPAHLYRAPPRPFRWIGPAAHLPAVEAEASAAK